jgi:hypothetical protein
MIRDLSASHLVLKQFLIFEEQRNHGDGVEQAF